MEWLEDGGSLPRLILLDLHIQAWKDGLGLLEILTAQPRLSHIPVVVFTGAIDPVLLGRARQLGARDVIEKSPQLRLPATLVEVLKKVGL